MPDGPWLVVGLGNPGVPYAGNRHNVGFMVIDVLAARAGVRFKTHRSRAEIAETTLAGRRVVLAKPMSYMNDSGGPVAGLRAFFRIESGALLVVHDDLELPFGEQRVKIGGGDGGHGGLRSITKALSGNGYTRVRFGIGRPPGHVTPADFVLADFTSTERRQLGVELERAADDVETIVSRVDGEAADPAARAK